MIKHSKLAVAITVACSFAGAAQAFDPAVTAVDYRLVIGGATAPTNTIRDIVIRDVCDVTKGAITQFLWQGTPHYTIACRTAANRPILVLKNDGGSGTGTTPVDERVALEVLESPTFAACTSSSAQNAFGVAYTRRTCGSTNTALLGQRVPDFGVSDIEPSKFVGDLAPPEGSFRNVSNMRIDSVAGLGFGVLVSTNLYRALQNAQFPASSSCSPLPNGASSDTTTRGASATAPTITAGANGIKDAYEAFATNAVGAGSTHTRRHAVGDTEACMPSLSRSQVETLLMSGAAGVELWSELKVGNSDLVTLNNGLPWGVNAAEGKDLKIMCRRTTGSGTHAQNAIYFLRTQCGTGSSSGGQVMPTGSDYQAVCGGAEPCDAVLENVASGNLLTCVSNMTTQGYWAIGYASVESNSDLASNARFIKVDGVAPTLANMVDGSYPNFGELTVQSRSGGAATAYETANIPVALKAEAKTHFDRIVQELTTVPNVVALNGIDRFRHPFGNTGFLARGTPTVFKYDPLNPSPIATQTHADPAVLDAFGNPVQNTCFGPIMTQGVNIE